LIASLGSLDHCFFEEEIWNAIRAMPLNKAPGLDGFIGLSFQNAWHAIKADIKRFFQHFLVPRFSKLLFVEPNLYGAIEEEARCCHSRGL
jgi:hypothetical protein